MCYLFVFISNGEAEAQMEWAPCRSHMAGEGAEEEPNPDLRLAK